jgi:LacI family transcriptional regulator
MQPSQNKKPKLPIRTQKQLAELAGVSLTTVYNCLYRKNLVNEKTRKQILGLMQEYDYQPDDVARSMVLGKTHVLGIIIPRLEITYYARLASFIERFSKAKGYRCIICQHLDDPLEEETEVTMMRQRRVDGIFIRNCGKESDTALFKKLDTAQMPFVLLDSRTEGFDRYFVGIDDRANAREAVGHLIKQGHRRIAHLAWSRTGSYKDGPRFLGYADALKDHGIEIDSSLIETCQTEYSSGRLEILNILHRTSGHPPTAVFAFNDYAAIGALTGLREAGVKVPDQISVFVLNGYIDETLLPTAINRVTQTVEEMARLAVDMLVGQMEDKPWTQGPILVQGHFYPEPNP